MAEGGRFAPKVRISFFYMPLQGMAESVIPSSNNYNKLKLQHKAYRYLIVYHAYTRFLFINQIDIIWIRS